MRLGIVGRQTDRLAESRESCGDIVVKRSVTGRSVSSAEGGVS